MNGELLNAIRVSTEFSALEKEYMNATKELSRSKGYFPRRRLKERIDELKLELGWTYLDCVIVIGVRHN